MSGHARLSPGTDQATHPQATNHTQTEATPALPYPPLLHLVPVGSQPKERIWPALTSDFITRLDQESRNRFTNAMNASTKFGI
jgi:hypothetical protein